MKRQYEENEDAEKNPLERLNKVLIVDTTNLEESAVTSASAEAKFLIIEPFYGGSHKQLITVLLALFTHGEAAVFSLPARKWKW